MPLRWPFGAPGEAPPCNLHRPFGMAADRQERPLRVRAPQRGRDRARARVALQDAGPIGLLLDFKLSPPGYPPFRRLPPALT